MGRAAVAVAAALAVAACRATQPLVGAAPGGVLSAYVAPLDAAVLPFQNVTEEAGAGERAASAVAAAISAEGIALLSPDGAVRAALSRNGIRWTNRIDLEQGRTLARDLEVDYIVTGSVTAWRGGADPAVGLHVRLIDVASGEIVFSATHDLSAYDRAGAFGARRLSTADAVLHVAAEEIARDLSLRAPIPGWERLDDVERRRHLARSAAVLDRLRRRTEARARDEVEEEVRRLRAEAIAAQSSSDTYFRAAALAEASLGTAAGARGLAEAEAARLRTENEALRAEIADIGRRAAELDARTRTLYRDLGRRAAEYDSAVRALNALRAATATESPPAP